MQKLSSLLCRAIIACILISATAQQSSAQAGTHLNFDGVNDFVSATQQTTISNNFTMEFWVNPTATTNLPAQSTSGIAGTIAPARYALFPNFQGGTASATSSGAGVTVGTNGICVIEHAGGYVPSLLTYTGAITGWTHVAVVYTAKQPSLYINGVLVATGLTSPMTNVYPSNSGIGGFPGGWGFFSGSMDELRFWNYSVTVADILRRKNCELQGNETGLLGYYKFNQGIGGGANAAITTLNGSAPVPNNGTLNNFALTGATSNWLSGSPVITGSAIPAAPAASAQSFCSGSNPKVENLVPAPLTNRQWYNVATGGTALPPTNALATGTYYVDTTNAASCKSARTAVNVTVNASPAAPTATATIYYAQGATATALTATGSNLLWYTVATNGTGSATAPVPSTATVDTTSYWVSQTVGGCESPRTKIDVIVALSATHLNFDGTNDIVNLGNTLNTAIDPINTFTIEAWVRPETNTGLGAIIGNYNYTIVNNQMQFLLRRENANYTFWVNDVSFKFVTATGTVVLNTWQHVAGVWNGSDIKIYVDGVLRATATAVTGASFATTSNSVAIGGNANNEYFKGGIDEIRIWNTAVNATDLVRRKNCELNGNESGLIRYYKFNQGLNAQPNTGVTTLTDASAAANNGTVTNFALTGAASNWLSGSQVVTGSTIPAAPTASAQSICSGGRVADLIPAPLDNRQWYNVATGGTALLPTAALATGTYYVDTTNAAGCKSARTAVSVTVNASPSAPTAAAQSFCGSTTVLSLVPAPSATLRWYNVATSGTALGETVAITSTGTYYAAAVNAAGCESVRTPVTVTINTLPVVNPISNQTVCNGASTTAVYFTGTASYYTWTNDNTTIGLEASGTGNIPAFTTTNTGGSAITANITATPINNPMAYVANQGSDNVSVINTTTNMVIATIPVGSYPYGVSVSPDGSKVYVTNHFSNNVSVINTVTNTVTATVDVGLNPFGVSVSPDGSKVYVVNHLSNNVSVINTTTNMVIATIPVGLYPYGVSVSPDGSKVYVANYFSNNVSVINTVTNTVTATVDVGLNPLGVSVSPDGSKVYVANFGSDNVSVINTVTNTVTATVAVGSNPRNASVSPDGSKVYVANEGSNDVSVINTATNAVVATVAVGIWPNGISVSPDGSRVYVTNVISNNVTVIITVTNTVIATVEVGASPHSLGNFITNTPNCTGTAQSFTITVNPKPAAPTSTAQSFCSATVADLIPAPSTNMKWYNVASGGTALADTTALNTGTYYVDSTGSNGCVSSRTAVSITVGILAPTGFSTQIYAGVDSIASLTATGANIKWYDAATAGNLLPGSTVLVNGTTYYASQTVGTCESGTRLAVTVRKISEATQTLCGPATVANLASTPSAGHTAAWFTTASGGTALAGTTAINTATYYVEQFRIGATTTVATGFNQPAGIAVQADGKILIADRASNTIKRMNADGSGIETLGSGFDNPWGVAVQADGKILVADTYNVAIKRMNADGTGIVTLGSGFYYPFGVAVQADGKILVADTYNHAIKRMNVDGTGIVTLGTGFSYPKGVAEQADGKIVVAEDGTNSIKRMNADGTGIVTLATGFNQPYNVAVQADGKILVADAGNHAIKRMNADGTGIVILGSGFSFPQGVAVEANGNIVVGNTNANNISRITEASNSNRVAVGVTVNTTPAVPTATAQSFCGSATVASLVPAPSANMKWYNVATGGTALAGTTTITASGTYYVDTTNASGCTSSRTSVAITINALPAAPAATAQSFCSATVADLVPAPSANMKWYNMASGGTALADTTALSTGTYYVDSTGSNGCVSSRTNVNITVGVLPPTATTTIYYMQGATATALTATGTNLLWYTVATGGTGSTTAPTPSTATVGTTSYWVSQTVSSCESPRTKIDVVVALPATHLNFDGVNDYVQIGKPTTSDFTISYWLKTNQTAPTGGQWYNGTPVVDAEEGGVRNDFGTALVGSKLAFGMGNPDITIFSTTNVNTNNWIHVAVSWKQSTGAMRLYINGVLEASGTGSTALRNATPGIRFGTFSYGGRFFAGNLDEVRIWNIVQSASDILLNMTCELAGNEAGLKGYYKFNQGINGGPNTTVTTLSDGVTPPNNGILTNFALTGTTSNWLAGSPVNTIPAAPTATAQSFCSATVADLIPAPSTNMKWYNVASGGTALATTTALATGTYYVDSTGSNGCVSIRTPVSITVGVLAPTGLATQIYAGTDSIASLTATGANIKWYDAATAGNLLPGSTLLVNGAIYYASQTVAGCESGSRLAVTVRKISEATQTFCAPATVANLASTPSAGQTAAWFSTTAGGTALAGTTAINTGTYYVEQFSPVTTTTVASGFNQPSGIAVQADGKIVIADRATNTIKRMNADGTGVVTLGSGFNQPYGVAIQADGKILVADSYNFAIKRMNADGTGIVTLGSGFYYPLGVAVQADGKILVADSYNYAIKRMNADGTGIVTLGDGFSTPYGVTEQADGKIVVADYGTNSIKRMNADGTGIVILGSGFNQPYKVAVQADGKILVADAGNDAIKRMNADGTGIVILGTGISFPQGVAVEANGNIVVGNTGANNIKRISTIISNRVAVGVTVNTTPAAPTATAQSFCGSTTVASLVPAPSANMKWYNVATGGTALADTTALSTGTYYVDTTSASGCASSRTSVPVVIGTIPVVNPISSQAICNGASTAAINFTGTATTYNWANDNSSIGLAASGTGNIPSFNAVNVSASPVVATITVTPQLSTPGSSGNILTNGGFETGSLAPWANSGLGVTGVCGSTNQDWKVSNDGGTGTGCNNPGNPTNGIYAAYNMFDANAPLTYRMYQTITVPSVVSSASLSYLYNYFGSFSGPNRVFSINIYNQANTVKLATLDSLSIAGIAPAVAWTNRSLNITALLAPFAGQQVIFDISAIIPAAWTGAAGFGVDNIALNVTSPAISCTGTPATFTITVNPTPAAPTASAQSFCNSTTVANLVPAPSATINWYDVATGGTALADTTSITSSGTYYVDSTNASGCTSSRTSVSVTIDTIPAAPTAAAQSFCYSTTVASLVPEPSATIKWYSAATGGTVLAGTTAISTNGTYYVSETSAGGCESNWTSVAITINAPVLAASNIVQILPVIANTVFHNNCNDLIATVNPNGASPVSGNTTAKVWIENTQPSLFVKRHYEITPDDNAGAATGTITLYFTQAEFNDYNTVNAVKLPDSANDLTGKANLLIEKRGGVSGDSSGLPSSYSGSITTINPADADIVWNATDNRWEVSFDVTGFSGFFVKTTNGTLPVRLLSFTGSKQPNNNVLLQWQTTNEQNVNRFEVESSVNGSSYSKVGSVAANNRSGVNNYQLTDIRNWNSEVRYYRLKMIDNDGKFSYSVIVRINNGIVSQISIYPNPAKDVFSIQGVENSLINTQARLIDAGGKVVSNITIKGQSQQVNIANLASGLYTLRFANGTALKLIKE